MTTKKKKVASKQRVYWGEELGGDAFQVVIKYVENDNCPLQKRMSKVKLSHPAEIRDELKKVDRSLIFLKLKRSMAKTKRSKQQLGRIYKEEKTTKKRLKLLNDFFRKWIEYHPSGKPIRFLQKKNKNRLFKLKNVKHFSSSPAKLELRSHIWFFPNKIKTDLVERISSQRRYVVQKLRKTLKNSYVVEKLKFLFVDVDNKYDEVGLKKKIDEFRIPPDVIICTSPSSFHLYWSFIPQKVSLNEGDVGIQRSERLDAYRIAQRVVCKHFGGDQTKISPSILLRVPDTYNYKPSKKRRPFKAKYLTEKNLVDAMKKPANKFLPLVEHCLKFGEENKHPLIVWHELLQGIASDQESEVPPSSERSIEPPEVSPPKFDFDLGAEGAMQLLRNKDLISNGSDSNLDYNLELMIRYLWKNRLRHHLYFTRAFRESLKGRGGKYAELNQAIHQLNRIWNAISQEPLLELIQKEKFMGKDKRNKTYKLNSIFIETADPDASTRKTWSDFLFFKKLYPAKGRNKGLLYDTYCLKAYSKYNRSKAKELLVQKVAMSSSQPDGCDNDISNVDSILDYHYKP